MSRLAKLAIFSLIVVFCLWSSAALAELEFMYQKDGVIYYQTTDGRILAAHKAIGVLTNEPDYDWWYGCSPTSVGMMMGFYDRNGYGGECYDNAVPGGEAELSNYGDPGAIANDTIASAAHISDYWPNPDVGSHSANSLADFMGTSQDLPAPCGYPGLGGTWFYNWTDGSPFTPADAVSQGLTTCSGMYGVYEYLNYRGYNYASLFNQYINPYHASGFTLSQYQTEIDGARPMVIQVSGHSMFGYGYSGSTVYVHDTWTEGTHTFSWGTNYSGLTHYGVMPLTITGGDPCVDWDRCYKDTNYITEYQLNIEGDKIRGQAIAEGFPGFPAPITGIVYNNKALFAINYLGDGMRFYQVSMFTGAGTTWGILDSGEYYDTPHSAQITGCGALFDESEPATGAFDETAVNLSGGDVDVELAGWDRCFYASDFPAELLEMDVEGVLLRGQCTYYPAPLTGYIHSGRAFFAIGYLNDNMRFYEVALSTKAGTGWAILGTDSSYYSTVHSVTIYPCAAEAVEPGVGGTGDGS